MNMHLSREQIETMRIHSASILSELVTKEAEPRKRKPWSHTDEGRQRRKVRRAAIRAKMAWLED